MTALATRLPSTMVALNPNEVPAAQAQLLVWCRQKIAALGEEWREQRENARHIKALKGSPRAWQAQASKTKQRILYYAKLFAAVRAGYLIVPNFNVDVVAVRTAKNAPADEVDNHVATPDLLPGGRGRYVAGALTGHTDRRCVNPEEPDKSKRRFTTDFHPDAFTEGIGFPIQLIKPAILDATQRAAALKLFDRIGVVSGTGTKSDPIVVGQIIDPRTSGRGWQLRHSPRCVSFFIAWWIDVRDLD